MRLLDLFCGAGGSATGYYRAGFNEIVGVDIEQQPRYPFDFVQDDALTYLSQFGHKFDLIHASPPCQVFSVTKSLANDGHPNLLAPTRTALQELGKPYVIENVPGAPMKNPLMLCGTMFGLRVIRHRLFETSPVVWWPPATCNHWGKATGCSSEKGRGTNSIERHGFAFVTVCGNDYLVDEGRMAMGIDWMTKAELSQAIPPAYTEWLGRRMLEKINQVT